MKQSPIKTLWNPYWDLPSPSRHRAAQVMEDLRQDDRLEPAVRQDCAEARFGRVRRDHDVVGSSNSDHLWYDLIGDWMGFNGDLMGFNGI